MHTEEDITSSRMTSSSDAHRVNSSITCSNRTSVRKQSNITCSRHDTMVSGASEADLLNSLDGSEESVFDVAAIGQTSNGYTQETEGKYILCLNNLNDFFCKFYNCMLYLLQSYEKCSPYHRMDMCFRHLIPLSDYRWYPQWTAAFNKMPLSLDYRLRPVCKLKSQWQTVQYVGGPTEVLKCFY